jgi:thiamine-phosphate pyrophosphorylase
VTWSLRDRSLYLCTPVREDLERFVAACVEGGVDVVQLREKARDDATILRAAAQLSTLCRSLGVPFVVNDRCDVALAVGADGVHVGQDDLPASTCRQLLGPEAIVGLSTHSAADLALALDEPVTYLSAGPIAETPTKPGRPATGPAYAALATTSAAVPVFVTGGVTPESVPGLAALGVRHFVVVRALTESSDPRRAALALAAAIRDAVPTD